MKPIDKLSELDYTEVFSREDIEQLELGLFCIFSDNGHFWHIGALTGIEEASEGRLYRNEGKLQFKHCRSLKVDPRYCQKVIAGYDCVSDYYHGIIIGEYEDRWLIMAHRGTYLVPKSKVAFIDDIKFGGEEA